MEKTYKRVIIIDHVNDNFISKGKLGAKSGEGFYKYPNPEYEQEGFIPKF